MNKHIAISLMLTGLLLGACQSSDSPKPQNQHTTSIVTHSPKDDDKTPPPPSDTCDAYANPITPFIRIQLHYALLLDQAFVPDETGGLLPLTLTQAAAKGDTTLQLESSTALVPGQLITYYGENFDYNVTRIASINGNQVTLDSTNALAASVAKGQNLWNFYQAPSHPNSVGYQAWADFAYRSTATLVDEEAVHVLFGDSWFSIDGFAERLALRYPKATIINKGQGGDTLCSLLARFDTDVPASTPTYVWINSSVNDYYNNVSQENFKLRLQDLISKVQAIGATAIVMDAAPAPNGISADGTSYRDLARRYATQVLDLYNEAQLEE